MDQNRLTEKSLEALSAAQRLAAKLNHQQMDAEHLLLALLDQERGLATSILNKADIPVDGLKLKVHRELEKLPRVTGGSGDVGMTGRLNRLSAPCPERAGHHGDAIEQIESALLHVLAGDVLKSLPARKPSAAIADLDVTGHRADLRIGEMAH